MLTKMNSLTVLSLLFAVFVISIIQDLSYSASYSSSLVSSTSSITHTHSHSSNSYISYASAAIADDDDDDDLDQFDDEDDDVLDDISTIDVAPSGPKQFTWADTEATTFIWNLINNHDVAGVQAILAKDPDSVRYRSKDGRSALHWAYEYNYPDLVDLLLAAGADPEAVDAEGNKPRDMTDKDEL